MPIQPFIARPISFDEANPFVTGLKKGSDIASEFMDNLQKSIALKYADQNQQAALAEAQARVPYIQAQTQGILQGDIPYKQAQVREIDQGQIPLQQSQSGYYGAETNKLNALLPSDIAAANLKLKYPGLSLTGPAAQVAAAQYYDDIQRNASKQNDIANAAAAIRSASTPSSDMSLASNPLALQTISKVLGQQQNTPGLNLPQTPQQVAVLQNMFGDQLAQQQSLQQQQPNQVPVQQGRTQSYGDMIRNSIFADLAEKQARTNYFNTTPAIRAATNPNLLAVASTNRDVARGIANTLANQVSPGSKASEQDVDNFMQYAGDAALKKVKTGTQLNQMQYGANLGAILDQATPLIPSVIKYSGIAGKFKNAEDALKAFANSNPEDYTNLNNFLTVTVPLGAGEIGRTLGKQATDTETKALKDVMDPNSWKTNPSMALQKWNFLLDSVKGKNGQGGIGQSLAASNAAIRQSLTSGQPLSGVAPAMQPSSSINSQLSAALGGNVIAAPQKGMGIAAKGPDLQTFLRRARILNPGVSDKELTEYYNNKYGKK